MVKLDMDNVLNEIDAFLEEEKKSKRKRRTKKEIEIEEVQEEVKPKRRSRKVVEEVVEEKLEVTEEISTIEDEVEDLRVVEETQEIPEVEEDTIEDEVPVVEETEEIEVVSEEDEEDEDIYITQSFQPIKKKKRLKRGVIKFFKALIILAILVAVGVFAYIKIMDIYSSTRPINIYKSFVNGVVEESTKTLNNINVDEYKFDVDVDTNMSSYDYLNKVNFGYGFNVKEDKYQDYIYYVDNFEEEGVYTLIDGENMYKQYTTVSTVNTYTVTAYLDENRTVDASKPSHVVNKEKTAEKLSSLLDMSEEKILSLLNKENMYQVYLKKGISEEEKSKIASLKLPGIEFIATTKGTPKEDNDVYKIKNEGSGIRDLIKVVSSNYDNLDDIIEGNGKIINDILKEEYIEEKDDEIDVNGQSINVKCLSLKITDSIIKDYINELEDDKKLMSYMSELLNKNEDALIRYIEDELDTMEGNVFNLYITKDYKLVGFDYVVDGFRDIYVYSLNGTYDVSIKFDKYVKYILNSFGIETNNINNLGLEIKDDKEFSFSTDSVDKFDLVIKQFDKSTISFEYKNASRTKGMEVVIKNDNVVIEYKNDDGKYFDMDIKLSKTEYINMFSGDIVTSSKKINEARNEFYSGMNKEQKETYNLIDDIINGER